MIGRITEKILLIFLLAIILFPIAYALMASFFSPMDFTDSYAHFLPSSFSLDNYRMALGNRYYPQFIVHVRMSVVFSAKVLILSCLR